MTPMEIHPEAVLELEQTLQWYQSQSIAAAQGFLKAIEEAFFKINESPRRFPKVDTHHRSCNLLKYPFQIIYRHDEEKQFVVAIVHAKRRPGYWRSRFPVAP